MLGPPEMSFDSDSGRGPLLVSVCRVEARMNVYVYRIVIYCMFLFLINDRLREQKLQNPPPDRPTVAYY